MRSRRVIPTLVAAVAAGVVAACAGTDDDTVTVFAASSLTAAFTDLGEAYSTVQPDVDIEFNFAASSELVAQIIEGAPADVFAAADDVTMARLVDAGRANGPPHVFATNSAAIMVAPGNPLAITDIDDLADSDLVVVLCAPDVPCGRYAEAVLDAAGVVVSADSLEENVRSAVTKVTLGEADAAIVYTTDVLAARDGAAGVPIPTETNVVADYPIAVTADADDAAAARSFVEFVRSEAGQAILADYGFGAP